MNKLFTLIKNTFYPNNEEHYDFILPENSAERAVPRSPPPFGSSIAENSIRFNYGNK